MNGLNKRMRYNVNIRWHEQHLAGCPYNTTPRMIPVDLDTDGKTSPPDTVRCPLLPVQPAVQLVEVASYPQENELSADDEKKVAL